MTDNTHAYHAIMADARDYANHDTRKPYFLGGDFFRLPPVPRSLELQYDVDLLRTAIAGARADTDETYRVLKEIVYDAIQRALRDNAQFIVTIILDEARQDL